MLRGHVDPPPGPRHHSFCIDGSKAELWTHSQPTSISEPVPSYQLVPIGGVGNQVLNITPGKIRARQEESTYYSTGPESMKVSLASKHLLEKSKQLIEFVLS